jgi:hypothetical protein
LLKIERFIMITSLSDALRDAGASPTFWLALAAVLVIASVGYLVARRGGVGSPTDSEGGKVISDWTPTGRIDFAGPSMDATTSDTPARFYLQAEDIRMLVSFSGIERKEIRWRRATLSEAKKVVNVFHRQLASQTGNAFPSTTPSGERATEDGAIGEATRG